ncbi:MAG TPA: hypothetical protein VGG01_24765 [Xanthobacteraceae bacterium]|jgi:hypothetical protein
MLAFGRERITDQIEPLPNRLRVALDAVAGMGAIMQAIGVGDLGAREAGELASVVAGFSQTVTTAQMEQRLADIEKAVLLLNRE